MGTSIIYAFEYLMGFPIFGLVYWILNGILVEFRSVSVQDDVYLFANWMWSAAVIIYVIFGMFWFYRSIKTWKLMR